MKRWKVYALCAMCVIGAGLLTGCGNREKDGTGTLNNERTEENRGTDQVNEGVNDATGDDMTDRNENTGVNNTEGIGNDSAGDQNTVTEDNNSGVGNAVEDLADGVGNAGSDIVDGIKDAGDALVGDDTADQSNDQPEDTDMTGNQ